MNEAEARALAAKREAHKSKHMKHKRWEAQHNSVKGWHVALVDCLPHQRVKPEPEPTLLDVLEVVAPMLLMARVRQALNQGRDVEL